MIIKSEQTVFNQHNHGVTYWLVRLGKGRALTMLVWFHFSWFRHQTTHWCAIHGTCLVTSFKAAYSMSHSTLLCPCLVYPAFFHQQIVANSRLMAVNNDWELISTAKSAGAGFTHSEGIWISMIHRSIMALKASRRICFVLCSYDNGHVTRYTSHADMWNHIWSHIDQHTTWCGWHT